jgi:hypothetical protein
MMPNADNIQVYLDGVLINREVTSSEAYWIVTFNYHHSSHQVLIDSVETQTGNISALPDWLPTAILIGIAVLLLAVLAVIVWLAKKTK